MNSKRLVVGIAALLLSALFFSSVFTEEAEAQVSGEMIAPVAAAVGGLFLGIGNVLNSMYTSGLSILLTLGVLVDTIFTWFAGFCATVVLGMCPGFVADIAMTCIAGIHEVLQYLINGLIDFLLFLYTSICGGCLGIISLFFTFIVAVSAFCVDLAGSLLSFCYEAICGAGSGFVTTFAYIWVCFAGLGALLGVAIPCLSICCGTLGIGCGWIPGCVGGFFGAIADGITGGIGGFLG